MPASMGDFADGQEASEVFRDVFLRHEIQFRLGAPRRVLLARGSGERRFSAAGRGRHGRYQLPITSTRR